MSNDELTARVASLELSLVEAHGQIGVLAHRLKVVLAEQTERLAEQNAMLRALLEQAERPDEADYWK